MWAQLAAARMLLPAAWPVLKRHPDWIRARVPTGERHFGLKDLRRGLSLHTVLEAARCPNIGECWDQRTATVMILGDVCTRACDFCAIRTGRPTWLDDDEPRRVPRRWRPWTSTSAW